jgi:hypothetical protein
MFLLLRVYADNQRFPKSLRNCKANYVLCVFLTKKQVSTLTLQMYCGLHFQFRRLIQWFREFWGIQCVLHRICKANGVNLIDR